MAEYNQKYFKILVVDDDRSFLNLVEKILSGEMDIEVIGEARDGEEAISKAKELKPDIVLMDVRMPNMNGLTATRKLKQIMPEVRTIILTIYDIDEYREAAINNGASGFVLKKIMRSELVKTIREVVSSGK